MEIISKEDAKNAGKKRFFTGIACFRGHVCERLVSNALCVECARINKNADKARNPERERARRRKYYAENPERVKAWSKAAAIRRREKVQKREPRSAEDRRAVRLAGCREWRSKHREAENKRTSERDRLNPEGRRVRDRNRRARKRAALGRHTTEDIKKLFSSQKGKCATCRESILFSEKHVDHLMPLALGGTNWPDNLQILCRSCNLRKSAKHPLDWARENGLLV